MSQKIIFYTQSWQVVRLSHFDSVSKIKFGSEISMKTFFRTKKVYVHGMNAHMFFIIQRLWKTSKIVFQSVISTWKESTWYENSSKIFEKFQIGVRNFDEFFFIKIFLIIHSIVKTFRILPKNVESELNRKKWKGHGAGKKNRRLSRFGKSWSIKSGGITLFLYYE